MLPTFLSLIIPMLPGIITGVESLFGKGQGSTKMDVVTQLLTTLGNTLASNKIIPSAPSGDQITTIIETVVQDLISKGVLNSPIPSETPSTPKPDNAIDMGTLTFVGGSLVGVRQFPRQGS